MKTNIEKTTAALSFFLVALGLAYACIEGSYNWRGRLDAQLFGLVVFGGGLLGWLTWRGLVRRAALPRTGLGWVFALGAGAVLLSLLQSGDPRQSLWRVSWLAGYVVLFYVLVDGFRCGWLERKAALAALLAVSGVVVALALLETYAWYLRWFAAVGSGEWPPFQYRFGSIFGYSNVLMSLANLGAPLALMVFLKASSRIGRIGAAAWLLFYLAAIPFSSSRGGWMGLIGWIGALALAWLVVSRPWRMVLRWRRVYKGLALAAGALALAAAGFLGLRFWLAFAAHPSHGGDPFGGRSALWAYAIQMWQHSPLSGIGPGRYTLVHPSVNPRIPPDFWSYNAHGMPVEILTEFGILGAVALVLLIAVGGWRLWQRWRSAENRWRPYGLALLAGLTGWLCQMIVDDFTSWIAIMVPLVMTAAWILALPSAKRGGESDLQTAPRRVLPLNLMWIPALALLGYAGWDLWGYAPAWDGVKAANRGEWSAAAERMSASARRDPNLGFYATEAGFAEAWVWQAQGEEPALERAREWFEQSLAREPQLSMLWANLAALDWQAGEESQALERMRQASVQSPAEPSYPLNLGYYLEGAGEDGQALGAYQRALDLAPEWAAHPFWQSSPLRARALREWTPPPGVEETGASDMDPFEEALRRDDFAAARGILARASIQADVTAQQARLSEAEGDIDAALGSYRAIRDLMALPILRRVSSFSFAYSLWAYNRPGLLVDRVPGYLNLDGDPAQFAALEHLHDLEVQRGECAQAAKTWVVWQQAARGFVPEAIPPAPACP